MRLSDRVLTDTARYDLAANLERLNQLQQQVSTGKRISVPSDDPAAAAEALRDRNDLALNEEYTRVVDAAKTRLSATDSAFSSLTEDLQRARELTVQAGNDTLGPQDLQPIAAELNQLIQHMVQLGNTQVSGSYIFAGTKTQTVPFTPVGGNTPASVTYNGNGGAITQTVSAATQMQINVPGDQVFTPAIDALIQVRDALNNNDNKTAAQSGLPAIDAAMNNLLGVQGTLGARTNSLDSLETQLGNEQVALQTQDAQLEDTDMTDAIVKLNAAQNAYQASLGGAAKTMQPTLLEFLK
jgi:flagellar hook-associated protein 3 FlgL